jgi:hypothetical protein
MYAFFRRFVLMEKIVVNELTSNALRGFTEAVELCDPTGRVLGRFFPGPRFMLKESDQCPYSEEELEEMRRDKSDGRTLAEFWRDLGRFGGDEQPAQ